MENFDIPSDKREFRCVHCNGKILIPGNLPPTTAPCPHCGREITSPAEAVAQVPVPTASPPPAALQRIPEPRRDPLPSPPASSPSARDGKSERAPASTGGGRSEKSGLIPVMLVLLALILCAGTAVYFVANEMGRNIPPPVVNPGGGDHTTTRETNYIRIGWQKDAYQVLRNYMAATSSRDKLPFIINGEALASRLEDFYGGGVINDSDTPADAFSIYELSEEDRKRGIFMMIYDQPPQFGIREFFRPLAPLEVQYGMDEADLLLSTLARAGNFAMEPLRVHAFFKRTAEGLKLDWEVFAQTKYRTFQNFVELPESGHSGIFRVFIVEDVPDKNRPEAGARTYRLADPANTSDTARVNVKVDSEIGRALSVINWRGAKEARPITRTVTLELAWTGEENAPQLEIRRFICWEFLGLGGGESKPTASLK
jgi:hypothetical protein